MLNILFLYPYKIIVRWFFKTTITKNFQGKWMLNMHVCNLKDIIFKRWKWGGGGHRNVVYYGKM